jgi:hypothetical protein
MGPPPSDEGLEAFFTYGFYPWVLGLFILLGSVVTVGLGLLALLLIRRQPAPGFIGLLVAVVIAFWPYYLALELWRSRPTRISSMGIQTYFFGRCIRFTAWDSVKDVVKSRYIHPMDPVNRGEMIWFRTEKRVIASQSIRRTPVPWGWKFALFPSSGAWMTNSMGRTKFRNACDIVTFYCTRHGVPIELWDVVGRPNRKRPRPTRIDSL